jgi:1,4-alpha-glucan branching enzyme
MEDLNCLYRQEPALHRLDFAPAGFDWIDCNDAEQSTLSLLRKGPEREERVIVALNFTPVPRHNYRVGAPGAGVWREALNSDAKEYGGSGQGNMGDVEAVPYPFHGMPYSLNITLPPLGVLFFKKEG